MPLLGTIIDVSSEKQPRNGAERGNKMIVKTSDLLEDVRMNLNKLNECKSLADCEKASRELMKLSKELRHRAVDNRWIEELERYGF